MADQAQRHSEMREERENITDRQKRSDSGVGGKWLEDEVCSEQSGRTAIEAYDRLAPECTVKTTLNC